MRKLVVLLLLVSVHGYGQVDFTTSHLPIIRINTELEDSIGLTKVKAQIDIIYAGKDSLNHIDDEPNEYSGHCGIKLRGESSLTFDKKSYAIETWDEEGNDIDTSFLGFPPEEDFILYGPYSDKTLINNVFTMRLAGALGQYASRTQFVELILNDKFLGLYVLMEKIKRDKKRVDISKLKTDDNTGDQLTGGYIIRIDHDNNSGFYSKYNKYEGDEPLFIQYYYPNLNDISPDQENYIQTYMSDFEDALHSPSFRNDKGKHYTHYIELRSFVDNFIINELVKNVDAYRLSSYFHKDRSSNNGRLKAGPVWDYNLSMGNASYCNTKNTWGWMYYSCVTESPFWWDRLFHNFTFTTALKCRWEALRKNELATDSILTQIEAIVKEIGPAAERHFLTWPVLSTYVWPNSDITAGFASHDEAIQFMKGWIAGRLRWMDNNLPGTAANCELFDDPEFEIKDMVGVHNPTVNNIQAFPNPTTGRLTIICNEPMHQLQLLNNLGQQIWCLKMGGEKRVLTELDESVAPGRYYLLIKAQSTLYQQAITIY